MADVYCSNCKYWSALIAEATEYGVQAMCLNSDGVYRNKYRNENATCSLHEFGEPVDIKG